VYIEICSDQDLDLLALINKQLIEDEQHENPMGIDKLKKRMAGFINAEYKAYLFKDNEDIKGYALVNHSRSPLYLRHFFICRDFRRQGTGRRAFHLLLQYLQTEKMDIEVMSWNKRGYEFWKSLGFVERSVYMRMDTRDDLQGLDR